MILPGNDSLWHEVFGCRHRLGENFLVCPLSAQQQPASVDVRLGAMLTDPHSGAKRPSLLLFPNEFMLGETLETVNIPASYAGKIEGKSSWGRTGLLVHVSAGWIDPGFRGKITLEMKNLSNVTINLRERPFIAQLALHQMVYPVLPEHMYSGRYQDAPGAEVAKL